jgi:hypothetical protein
MAARGMATAWMTAARGMASLGSDNGGGARDDDDGGGFDRATAAWVTAVWATAVRWTVARGTTTAVRFRRSFLCALALRLLRLDRDGEGTGQCAGLYTTGPLVLVGNTIRD